MSLEDVGTWLKAYGVDAFQGLCVLTYEDTIEVTVEVTAEADTMFLSALLGELSENTDAATLRKLLQLGHKGAGTGGANLSLNETGEGVVLWIAWPVSALDPEAFDLLFGSFLDRASALRTSLKLGESMASADEANVATEFKIQV